MKARALALLDRQHRRARWSPSLWVGTAGLALALLLHRLEVEAALRWPALGIVAALTVLVRIWPRRRLQDTARRLDVALGAKNRFEALAELRGRQDALAAALTTEVDRFLAERTPPRPYAWGAGLAIFAGLVAANIIAFVAPPAPRPMPAPVATKPASPTAPAAKAESEIPPQPAPIPAATLRWIAPPEETSATAKDEVLLSAEADSPTGLRQFSLLIALNGEARPPIPVVQEVEAGPHPVAASLLLESLEAQPYDIVTYTLRAERVRPSGTPAETTWPPVFSPLQMIQIRAPRDDISDPTINSENADERALAEIAQLKSEQFGLLRDMHHLHHDSASRGNSAWQDALAITSEQEGALAEKIKGAGQSIAPANLSKEAASALAQAEQEARESARVLKTTTSEQAVAPASRALSRLSAAEKNLTQIVRDRRARQAAEMTEVAARQDVPPVSDLPARETTPAGQLEKLAFDQNGLAERLAARSATGGFTEQDALGRQISRLAADKGFSPDISRELVTGAESAREAAAQLNDQDPAAATEPASRAAQALKEAVATQETVGRQSAAEEILAAQRTLIRTATDLQLATSAESSRAAQTAAQKITALQQSLRASARRQQERGSADAAQRLNSLSNDLAPFKVVQELTQAAKAGAGASENPSAPKQNQATAQKLTDLAQRSANEAANLDDARKAEARALEELRQIQANLERAKGKREEKEQKKNPPSPAEMADLYEKAVTNAQRLGGQGGGGAQPSGGEGAPGKPGEGGQSGGDGGGGQSGRRGGGGSQQSQGGQSDGGSKSASSSDGAPSASSPSAGSGGTLNISNSNSQSISSPSTDHADKALPTQHGSAPPNPNANTIQGLGSPPPPGPGRGAQEMIDYAVLLSQRVNGLINLKTAALRTTERSQVLTTGNPADAPPAYRSAVADYFEALARDRAAPAPRKP